MNLPFFEYLYARKAYLLTVLQLNSNTPGRRITAAIYTVKLTLFIWENIYPGLDRERQSEQLPHLTTSFCLTVVGRTGAADAATDILDTERACLPLYRGSTENTAPWSEAQGMVEKTQTWEAR